MKRWIAVLLALVMVLGMVGCGGSAKEPEPTAPPELTPEPTKEIELTGDNLFNYLHVDISFNKNEGTVTINTYPIVGGSFNNVKFIIHRQLTAPMSTGSYSVYMNDSAYKYVEGLPDSLEVNGESRPNPYKNWLITVITLPADGKYTETHKIWADIALAKIAEDEEFGRKDYLNIGELKNGFVSKYFVSDVLPADTPIVTGTFVPLS